MTAEKLDIHEQQVIGSLILDDKPCLYSCQKIGLRPEHFISPLAKAYQTIITLSQDRHAVIDMVSVSKQADLPLLMIEDIVQHTTGAGYCGYHAEQIMNAWRKRETVRLASGMINEIQNGTALHDATSGFFNAMMEIQNDDLIDITKVADHKDSKMEQWRAARGRGFVGIPSSFAGLNEYLGGWRKSLGLIGAYRGTGKSTIISCEALWQAKQGINVAIFTLEDSDDIIASRIAGNHADVCTFSLDIGHFTDFQLVQIGSAFDELKELPLWIVRKARTIQQITATANMLKKRYGLDMIYIDHIQLVSPLQLPNMNRNNTLSCYSMQLAELAESLGVPVVCASQLSRDCERDSRKPRLSDLRDSGSLEQDARQVLLLYKTDNNNFELEIAKNNYGVSSKSIQLDRVDGRQRFIEIPQPITGGQEHD